jgi:phage tail sheath protein FI
MPVTLSYPGLYIEELANTAHNITPAPTSITVFVGYAHPFQGECAQSIPQKFGKAIQVFNFTEFERQFGGLYDSEVLGPSYLAHAVNQFFLNGGTNAIVIGLKPAYYDLTNMATTSPIAPATNAIPFTGITFTAKQLTDSENKIVITIRNVRQTTLANDTADITITYGRQIETYRGVVTKVGVPSTITDRDYVANRLAGSRLVSVAGSGGQFAAAFTLSGASQSIELAAMPPPAFFATATTFNAADFVSVFAADSSLDKVDIFNLLVMPGVTDTRATNAALAFCHDKRAFYIMDAPEDVSADGMGSLQLVEDYVKLPTVANSLPNAALYFPYLKTLDPISGDPLELPPSGYVAGVYARTDTNRGVWKAPAGLETSIVGTTGVVETGVMTDMRQGTVNEWGVNVLRSFPGAGTVIWGARTIVTHNTAQEQWRYIPVRRTALFIEQTLLRNLGWVVFEPNDEPLWTAIRVSVEDFMLSLFRQHAFQGTKSPSEAFFVKCDKSTTTATDIANGRVNILVGFRPLKPAEFVVIQITQLAGQVQA